MCGAVGGGSSIFCWVKGLEGMFFIFGGPVFFWFFWFTCFFSNVCLLFFLLGSGLWGCFFLFWKPTWSF